MRNQAQLGLLETGIIDIYVYLIIDIYVYLIASVIYATLQLLKFEFIIVASESFIEAYWKSLESPTYFPLVLINA